MQHTLKSWALSVASVSVPQAYFLVGPTASGKTEIAHLIALETGAAILSADSMLVYQGMDIGTAKPTHDQRTEIPYFGIDVVPPTQPFNVARFMECARTAWRYCAAEKRPLLVVGGTGLYLKCLSEGLAPAPGAHREWRQRAEEILAAKGVGGLYQALEDAAPEYAKRIRDRNNPRRLIRALELAWEKAPLPSGWSAKPSSPMVGLRLASAELAVRIAERVKRMYERGLLDEMRRLLDAGGMSQTAQQAIGYAEAAAVLRGEMTIEKAVAKTIQRTRQLAKRQMTWFRHQANVCWLDVVPNEDARDVAARVVAAWEQYGQINLHI